MRILTAAASLLAAACFALPAPALALAGPVSLPPLAQGEVLLEVDGLGIVNTPATSATIVTTLQGQGTSQAEAQRSLDAEIARVTALARAAGAAPADIVVGEAGPDVMLRTFDVQEPMGADADAPPQPTHDASATVTIRLRNAPAAAALRARIGEGGEQLYGATTAPAYELADDSAARREARRRALAAARADADSYAEAAGMRIVRMVRITERAGLDFAALALTELRPIEALALRRAAAGGAGGGDATVTTTAIVGVDYVLAPR